MSLLSPLAICSSHIYILIHIISTLLSNFIHSYQSSPVFTSLVAEHASIITTQSATIRTAKHAAIYATHVTTDRTTFDASFWSTNNAAFITAQHSTIRTTVVLSIESAYVAAK